MFDFRQLRYFVAVAEELSFTRAALRLHISQPPLSQQIQSLERDLDVCLLERTKRRVALTEAGRAFLEEARQILAHAAQARSRAQAVAAGHSGQLRLACTVTASIHPVLPRILLQHRQAVPGVDVQLHEMHSEAQFAALLADEIDVGLVREEPHPGPAIDRLQWQLLDREPLLLALPAGHRLAQHQGLLLAEVAQEGFVMQPRSQAATLHNLLLTLADKAGFEPRIVQQVQQINGTLALVAAGLGLALVPASTRVVNLAGVCYVPVMDADACLPLALASRTGDPSPVVRNFLATALGADADAAATVPPAPAAGIDAALL